MANNTIDEALKQASGENKRPNNYQKSTVSSNNNGTQLLDERTDFKKIGFQDGIFMSADYQEGFVTGLAQGIAEARQRTLRAIGENLRVNREHKIALDYDFDFDCIPSTLPGLAIFSLPPKKEA